MRLTDKNKTLTYSEENQINLARRKNGIKIKSWYYGEPIERLAEFEDFMEEQGFESLGELKKHFEIWNSEDDDAFIKDTDKWKLWGYRFAKNRFRYKMAENQALKERWEKLKEWLSDRRSENGSKYFDNEMIEDDDILDKMEELEEEC